MVGMASVSLWPSSAKILFYIVAIQKDLRIFLNCVFTGGAVTVNGICILL